MISRRTFAHGLISSALLGPASAQTMAAAFEDSVGGIERKVGGRLGIAVVGPFEHSIRGDERFPLCSTFKLLAAAAILKRVDHGTERLDRSVVFNAGQVVVGSPVTL